MLLTHVRCLRRYFVFFSLIPRVASKEAHSKWSISYAVQLRGLYIFDMMPTCIFNLFIPSYCHERNSINCLVLICLPRNIYYLWRDITSEIMASDPFSLHRLQLVLRCLVLLLFVFSFTFHTICLILCF